MPDTMASPSPMLRAALELATLSRFAVFPCSPVDKKPLPGSHGFKDGTKDRGQITAWWTANPDAMIGVATGAMSGFFAVDLDDKNGKEGSKRLAELEAQHGALPRTPTQRTQSGGKHHLFRMPADNRYVPSRTDIAGLAGIDVRGDGGYIVVAPSIMHDGKAYEFVVPLSEPMADAPAWLLDLIGKGSDHSNGPPIGEGDVAPGFSGENDTTAITSPEDAPPWFRRVASALWAIDNREIDRGTWIDIMHAVKQAVAGNEDFYQLVIVPWNDRYKKHSKGREYDRQHGWDTISESDVGWGKLNDRAIAHGWKDPDPTADAQAEFDAIEDDLALDDPAAIEGRRQTGPIVNLNARFDLMAETAEKALAHSAQHVYAFGSFMVRPGQVKRKIWNEELVKVTRVVHMSPLKLIITLSRGVKFVKLVKRTGRPKKDAAEETESPKAVWVEAQGPTEHLAKLLLELDEWPNLPKLTGIVTHPMMRHDGTILDEPGYDEATNLLYISDGTEFPRVKDQPTDDDAHAALATLLKPIRLVPYAGDNDEDAVAGQEIKENERSVSRSVALSAMLSVPARYAVPVIPVFAYTAPRPGEAKTTHADIIAQMMEGKHAPITTLSQSEDEAEKQLKTVLKGGDPVITLNNLTIPLGEHALLCSATLDQGVIKFRDFHTLNDVEVPGNRIWMANGVRLVVLESMKRRTLLCRIDSGCEKPQGLDYPFSPRKLAHEMRPELVHAALTILRWHHNKGRKAPAGRKFADYEEWDALVPGALVALGEPDPYTSQDAIEAADDASNAIGRFFDAWSSTIGPNTSVGAQDIISAIDTGGFAAAEGAGQAVESELSAALANLHAEEAPSDRHGVTSQWLGLWLKSHDKHVANGWRLRGVYSKGAKAWRWNLQPARGANPIKSENPSSPLPAT